ncbi:MAG TPA: class II aldolase/adducin family protein [Micromonosporaceae bacterium]|nr:class II aldolase/adducin family protein [Micromonosporaceae bacterium]
MGVLLADERRQVVAYARRMVADRLVVGTSGNLSTRSGDLIAITPTAVDYDELTPDHVSVCQLDGARVDGSHEPTSELAMHLTAYRLTGAGAVVHTHSPAATAVSVLVDVVPSVHYLVGMFGGPIRVAPYATYGTPELADHMADALADRTGCLLGNHGTITVGDTLGHAYRRAQYLEWLCEVWLRARSAGEPRLLDDAEIEKVAEKLVSYGPVTGTRPDPR